MAIKMVAIFPKRILDPFPPRLLVEDKSGG
jgi:hypothetical protein